MKPIKLTLSGFGPFAEEAVIDFAALGDCGLYLITGNTGAGKTTLFDAVSFALYGHTSGRARSGDMLRSHFAAPETKTYVELVFEYKNLIYTVRRSPEYERPKVRGEGFTKEIAAADLFLPDGSSVYGTDKVNPKVEEIIGLTREQFSQIVMLAQGDFMRFLHSGTDERTKILRRIFRTERYEFFQNALKDTMKLCKDEYESLKKQFSLIAANVVYEGGEPISDGGINNSHSFMNSLAELIKHQEDSVKNLQTEYVFKEERRTVLTKQINEAAATNRSFEELEQKNKEYTALISKSNECESLKARIAEYDAAILKVKPLDDVCAIAEADYKRRQESLKEAERRTEMLAAEFEAKKSAYESECAKEDLRAELSARAGQLRDSMPSYEQLVKLEAELAEQIEKADAYIAGLEERSKKLKEFQESYIEAENRFSLANAKYANADKAFLREQAGIIAQTLEPGVPCPVCGATDHPMPAHLSDGAPSESELETLRTEAEAARTERDRISHVCGAEKSALDALIAADTYNAANAAKSNLEGRIADLSARLAYETISEAKSALESAESQYNSLTASFKKAKTEYETVNAEYIKQQSLTAERAETNAEYDRRRTDERNKFLTAVIESGFSSVLEYKTALSYKPRITEWKEYLAGYYSRIELLKHDIKRLESETTGKTYTDVSEITKEETQLSEELNSNNSVRTSLSYAAKSNADLYAKLELTLSAAVEKENLYAECKALSDTANGDIKDKVKMTFETYVQSAYFNRILRSANLRFDIMSGGRYRLIRREEVKNKQKKSGLDIDVFDAHTGKSRDVKSLSGGESFKASLSLALGLSDVVQASAGGIALDAMFIDEGFGSLDSESLDSAVSALQNIASNRIIGIISHVGELNARIEKQIVVAKDVNGSSVSVIV